VTKDGEFVGMVDETTLINEIMDDNSVKDQAIGKIMGPKLPVVASDTPIKELSKVISKDVPAALVDLGGGKYHIVTRHDLIAAIA
jgi:cystathionine beta-synthase